MKNIIQSNSEIVKAVYDLHTNYLLKSEDIARIMNGEPICKVVSNRIYTTIKAIQKNNEEDDDEYGLKFDEGKTILKKDCLENDLINNKEKVIDILKKYKKKLNNEYSIDDVNNIINIVKKLDEIIQKYEGKFKKNTEKNIVSGWIGKKGNTYIISEKLFNRVQKKLNNPKV